MKAKVALIIIIYVFNFFIGTLFAQNRRLDSLMHLLKNQRYDTTYINNLFKISDEFTIINNFKESKSYSEKALTKSKILNYKDGIIRAYAYIGMAYSGTSKFDSAVFMFNKAINSCDTINDKSQIARLYIRLSDLFFLNGDNITALNYAFKALKINEELNNKAGMIPSYNAIAILNYLQKNEKKALHYFSVAEKLAEETGNKLVLANVYNGIASVYIKNNKKKALIYLFKSLGINEKLGYKRGIAIALTNIIEVYMEDKSYAEAMKLLTQSKTIFIETNDERFLCLSYLNLGIASRELNKLNDSEKYLKSAITLANKIGNNETIKEINKALSLLYEKKGDYKQGLYYQKLYANIKDTMYNLESNNQIIEMNTKYETEKKDKELIKKDAEIALQQIRTEKQAIVRNSLIIGFIVLLGIIVFIYRGYLQKQKVKLEQIEKEKLKGELNLLKNQISPHVMFNLVNVIYIQIEKNKDLAREMMLKFSELLRYQLYECNVDFIEIEKEVNYLKKFIEIQQIRKSNRCKLEITLHEDVKGFLIAPLLLIPIIENAFKYVTNDKYSENYIIISLTKSKNELVLDVKNTCYPEQESKEYGGLGLLNLRNRLQLIYPTKHSFKFYKEDTVFTSSLKIDIS